MGVSFDHSGDQRDGFWLPLQRFLPSHAVGIVSLIALALAIYGRYSRRLAGAWRRVFVIGAVRSLYLNVFVLVVQLFLGCRP